MPVKPVVELLFSIAPMEKVALMPNISKTVAYITMKSMEVEYDITHGLSIGTMTLTLDDLEPF